tara:strand:- start:4 stop:1056 length:1053 start_codon:yes stop_codon:yes gene_type:complete
MAISGQAFSPKEFIVAVGAQTTLGQTKTDALYAMNVDSITHGTLGGINHYDLKSGGGRILQDEHYIHLNEGYVSEITVSGIYGSGFGNLLWDNITEDNAEVWQVPSNYEPRTDIITGVSDLSVADSALLTLVILPPKAGAATPTSDEGITYKDCVVTNVTWSGDMTDNGGLVKYSATFKTYTPPVLEHDADSFTINDYNIGTQCTFMSKWQTATNRKICGIDEIMVNSFTFTVDNDALFSGHGSNGVPEVISRQGEFSATADFNVKYDAESASLLNAFQAASSGAAGGTGATLMSNASTPATGASWGFQMPASVFTSVALSEGDVMAIDASVKMVGYGVGETTTVLTIAD